MSTELSARQQQKNFAALEQAFVSTGKPVPVTSASNYLGKENAKRARKSGWIASSSGEVVTAMKPESGLSRSETQMLHLVRESEDIDLNDPKQVELYRTLFGQKAVTLGVGFDVQNAHASHADKLAKVLRKTTATFLSANPAPTSQFAFDGAQHTFAYRIIVSDGEVQSTLKDVQK